MTEKKKTLAKKAALAAVVCLLQRNQDHFENNFS